MEMQILDCDYVMLNGKPLIRIYGKDMKGETFCVFYNKFLPYFYLHVHDEKIEEAIKQIKDRYPEVKIETVEKFLPIGYQPPVKVLKITGIEPGKTPEMKEFCQRLGTPYEADILFKYRFMADFDLRGMSWIDVKGTFQKTNTVKCKAIEAETIKPIEILQNAPLKYVSLDIECLSDEDRFAVPEKDRIIAISLAFYPEYKNKKNLVILARLANINNNVIGCADEKEMLSKFLEIIDDYDPDILIGHNLNNFDLPYVLKRLELHQLPRSLGRSDKNAISRKLEYTHMPTVSGRIVVDTFEIYKRDPWVKFKRYDLGTIAKELLGAEKVELGENYIDTLRRLWAGKKDDLTKLVEYTQIDAELALRLVVERGVLDKFFEIAKLSGVLLQDCLGGQTQRHEFRLLREFSKRSYIMPLKPERFKTTPQIKGAFVLDPVVGLHDWVILLDFTSLYPSLISSFNICPTTFVMNGWKDENCITTPYGTKFVKPSIRKGILPSVVDDILANRILIRKQMKTATDSAQKRILKSKYLALKDLLNSLYGYTGYPRARLYVSDIANTITAYGRETIASTKKMVEENFPVKVIYADTDSIFIKADVNNLEDAEKLANRVSEFVSSKLLGLELKFEKIYKTFLIETKKRYAGWSFERDNGNWAEKIEMKGIETVRRDWCTLVSETMFDVLNIVLKEKDVKKAARHVRSTIDDLVKGKVSLEKLTIVKGITKSLDSYEGVQPHVELAKKIIKREFLKPSIVGERLDYVIIKGNQLLSKRAEDPKYVKEKGLEIDPRYYIYNQLLPPLERIFDICGISASELLEGSKQKNLLDMLNGQKPQLSPEETILSAFDSVVCKNCEWSFRRPTLSGNCPKCNSPLYFSGDGSIGKIVELKP